MPENLYIIIIGILFILAISDIIVGVSNDAVNFLNSSLGSKAAPRYIIFIIASLGIIVGTTFSSGMMEVARKGIFHPEQFVFAEIIIIFIAVMLTDVILLDAFNTMALPTSTTVSIVFELLGAAVVISVIKIYGQGESLTVLGDYINSDKAMLIISGILLSIVIAFILGAIVQYFTRIIFSFNYQKTQKYFGAVWGGLALTAITYFILIKGANGSSLISESGLVWIQNNTLRIILVSFVVWTLIIQLVYSFFRINIFRVIILLGTFALALAFASNDLVNFIGVPLAGLKSFQLFMAEGQALSADEFTMGALQQPVRSNTYLLIIAGLVMVITLWVSRKARNVTKTEIDLSRQGEGEERFGSTAFSRYLVRKSIEANQTILKILPRKWMVGLEKRFRVNDQEPQYSSRKASFDMVRASVNLTIASIIISLATSLKLPLSTTYVTFMVAMGTSLSDRAWGRESAVFRITGVLTVIGGWFVTALIAFSVSGIVALFIHYGGIIAIIILAVLALILIIRTHKRTAREALKRAEEKEKQKAPANIKDIIRDNKMTITGLIADAIQIADKATSALSDEDRKELGNTVKDARKSEAESGSISNNSLMLIDALKNENLEAAQTFIQINDYLKEIIGCAKHISYLSWNHVNNNHKGLVKDQKEELDHLSKETALSFLKIKKVIETSKFDDIDDVLLKRERMIEMINEFRANQIKRIKKNALKTKNSLLFLNLLNEYKNLINYMVSTITLFEDFDIKMQEAKKDGEW